ncbi:uncharacterized protein [Maniola hyperantus]|uniref:uncharacterized protein n=1 Tax=Aphantopus hyperantus TaxID=2795564 RepID=UPI00374A14EB
MNYGAKINTNQTQFNKKIMNANETQFVSPIMRTQSTMTGFLPNDRCFCTLSLNKSKTKPPLPVKTIHASTATDVHKIIIHPVSNLLPYECAPNVCVPGECNPVLCLEKIKKRHKKLGTIMIESQKNTFGTTMEDLQKKNVATIIKKGKDAKNNKISSKQLHQIKSKEIHEHKTGNNNNRQAVRISSNFNFDIEFTKTNNPNYKSVSELPKPHKTKHQFKNKAANSNFKENKLWSRALQSSSPKNVSRGSSMGIFLKRCFCTLKLQKTQLNKIPIAVDKQIDESKERYISNENKSTATRKLPMETYDLSPFECEPFFCVPGEIDPHEWAKRIEMRDRKHNTQYTDTQSNTISHKTVGIKQRINMKSQRSQASIIEKNAVVPIYNINRPEIVEIPRFTNIFNKQAVRIGSNFSFNIEFCKENLPLSSDNLKYLEHGYNKKNKEHKKIKVKDHKNIYHHEQKNTNTIRLQSSASKYGKTKTKNKPEDAENILKRCFCTLKLQSKSSSEKKKQNMQSMIQFPQNFEVRRVAVQHNPKILSKDKHTGVKSVATKMNEKYLKKNRHLNAPCNISFCQNGETFSPEDMKTILPYRPEKFNKTVSRTVFPLENKYNKLKESTLTNYSKRLTRKKSEKYLQNKQPIIQTKGPPNKSFLEIKTFIRWCARIFHPKSCLMQLNLPRVNAKQYQINWYLILNRKNVAKHVLAT